MAEFAARLDELSQVLAHAERACLELGAPAEVGLRAALIVEELFINAVRHGRALAESLIRVELSLLNGEIELLFEDPGRAFDPFSHLAAATHRRPLKERPVGGLGVVLIDGLCLRHAYARVGARNRVRIWLDARSA